MVSRLQGSQEYPLFLVGDDTKVQKPLSISVFDITRDLPAALAKSSFESLISQPSSCWDDSMLMSHMATRMPNSHCWSLKGVDQVSLVETS